MKELNFNDIDKVSGGVVDFGIAGAGGALGGALATNSLAGAAAGSVLGLAASAAFALGYGAGSLIADNTGIDEFLGKFAFELLH